MPLRASSAAARPLPLPAAGRENFLAAEADRALTEMCQRCTDVRAIAALCANANHKSTHVRAKVRAWAGVCRLRHKMLKALVG